MNDIPAFRSTLYDYVELDEEEWKSYREEIKIYRDKDVAHIEVRPETRVPDMRIALKAADLYYQYALKDLSSFSNYSNEPGDLLEYCRNSQKQAEKILALAYDSTRTLREEVC